MGANALGQLILAGMRLLAWAYALQPFFLRRFWGEALGALLRVLAVRESVVRQNLALAYPGDEKIQRRLQRAAYSHLGQLILEIFLLLGPMRRYVLRNCELRGLENLEKARARGKGVILLASHVGNWELMAATGTLQAGVDLMMVTKHLKPQWLHQAIERGRASCGVRATYEPKTLRDIFGQLRRGGTVGIVLDQYAGAPIGVRVPFFGVPVGTSNAIATLARRTGAAVVPVVSHRVPGGRLRVEVRPEVVWISAADPARELALNTANYSTVLERDIREFPEQWLWTHRRFKGDLGPLREGEWTEGRART